jgi:adenylate cyclase
MSTDAALLAATREWLLDAAARARGADELLGELALQLRGGGVPVVRLSLQARILHPQFIARSYVWWLGSGVQREDRPHFVSDDLVRLYNQSPVAWLHHHPGPLRRRIQDADCPDDFPLLAELRARGATDYYGQRLVWGSSEINVLTWASDAPGGFSASHLALFEGLRSALATVLELILQRELARTLLEVYVGRLSGGRVLDGSLARGAREQVRAVVWYSDLSGFMRLSESVDPLDLLTVLDAWFEQVTGAVGMQGGEVVKFMGDGLLALFPAESGEEEDACRRALWAAQDVAARVATLALPPSIPGPLRFGIGLHLGDVLVGNVGASDRLDVTAVGPAINRAARTEALCRRLGVSILATGEVARHLRGVLRPMGYHTLRDIAEPTEVYAAEAPGS